MNTEELSYEERHRRKYYPWATDNQWDCIMLLYLWECGFHHFSAKAKPFGTGIEYNVREGRLSTYDSNSLTCLVFLAHDLCIRAEIMSSAPGRVRLILHKRRNRDGDHYYDRHPTIETAIKNWRHP